jgi:uncharacterized C2H2 Zn-finger protein
MAERPLPKFLEHTIYDTPEWIMIRGSTEHPQVRVVLDALVEKGIEAAVEAFNETFGQVSPPSHRLKVHRLAGRSVALDANPMTIDRALKALLLSDQPERVKRCPVCQTFFFDPTKRGTKTYDTLRCGFLVRKRKSRSKHLNS